MLSYKEKFFIKLYSCIYLSKKTRKRVRKILYYKAYKKKVQQVSWGVSYSVFDGEELLKASIMTIRDSVNYVNVVYQTESWYGRPANDSLVPLLLRLKEEGLIDELIEYKANPHIPAGVQERHKRQLGLDAAKKKKIHYFMTMDCDEFYLKPELRWAQKNIIKDKIDFSYCNIVNYGTSPDLRELKPTTSFIQFFSNISNVKRLGINKQAIALVDPTRGLIDYNLFRKPKCRFLHRIEMHHFTHTRKNLIKKLINSSAVANHAATSNINKSGKCFLKSPDLFNLLPLVRSWTHEKI